MGLIFDVRTAKLYESWHNSIRGKAIDKFLEKQLPLMLSPQANERALDIGCGAGNHLILLNKLGFNIHGIDASPLMISKARKRLGKSCSFRIGTAENLPFEDNEFDIAVLINTLEFLDDPLQAIREAARVTKRKIFIGVQNSFSWNCLYNGLFGFFYDNLYKHIRAYNLLEMRTHIRKALGDVPIEWKSKQIWPPYVEGAGKYMTDLLGLTHWPIGSFLGISITISYTMKVDTLPLKIRVKKPKHTVLDGYP